MKDETWDDVRALKEATREGHELLAELRSTYRAVRDAHDALPKEVDKLLSAQVAAGLATYSAAINRAIQQATASVHNRFDKLVNVLLAADRRGKRDQGLSLEELVDAVAALSPADRAEWRFRAHAAGLLEEILGEGDKTRDAWADAGVEFVLRPSRE